MKFSGKVGNGPTNKRLNFGGDPDRDTGKTCLGGGVHCSCSASSYVCHEVGTLPLDVGSDAISTKN